MKKTWRVFDRPAKWERTGNRRSIAVWAVSRGDAFSAVREIEVAYNLINPKGQYHFSAFYSARPDLEARTPAWFLQGFDHPRLAPRAV